MSLQFMQRELDALFDQFIASPGKHGNKKLRPKLDKQPHVGEFNASDLAEELRLTVDKNEQGVKELTMSGAGNKTLLKKYTKEVLQAFKNSPLIPDTKGKAQNNGKFRVFLMESDSNRVIVKVSGGNSFEYYRDTLNAKIQAAVILSSDEYKKLFGIPTNATGDQAEKRVKDTQQLGHADGQGVVNKKVGVFAAGVFGGDGDELTEQVILEDMPERSSGGTYKGAFEELIGVELEMAHVQQYRMKEGNFKDEIEIAVKVEGKEANQAKANLTGSTAQSKTENALGVDLAALIRELQADLKKELGNVKKGTRKERSPSAIQIVGHMVFAGSNLQKLLMNKKVSGKSTSPYMKAPPKPKSPSSVRASTVFKGKKPTYSKGSLTPSIGRRVGARRPAKKRVETGTSVQDSLVARAFINSRLPTQVANNMGRPELENRTGRFANSVNIVNASSTGNMSHFDYTYEPLYRVFESGTDYSPNYDPRPLIEKSIRQLAAARMETKFTLRRV